MKASDLKPGERTDRCRTMRYRCDRDGCFEATMRCHLGKLDHLLPGGNGMTDVDGYCHINGRRLFLEWKTNGGSLSGRQLEAFQALSRGATALVAWGDPVEMLPHRFYVFQDGELVSTHEGEEAKARFDVFIREWGAHARKEGLA